MPSSPGYPSVCLVCFLRLARERGAKTELKSLEAALERGVATVPWDVTFRLFDDAMSQLTEAAHHELAKQYLLTQPLFIAVQPFMASVSTFLALLWRGAVGVTMSEASSYVMTPSHHELKIDSSELGEGLGYHQISGLVAQHAPIVLGAPSMDVLEWECSPRTLRVRLTPPLELGSAERRARASHASLSIILQTLQLIGPDAVAAVRDGALVFPGRDEAVLDIAQLAAAWSITPAEARVALALGEGKSPAEIAAELSISVSTVRVHLKHLYAKTDTAGQRELTARVASWRRGE